MTPETALNVGILAVSLVTALLGLPPLLLAAVRLLQRKHSAEDLRLLRDAATQAVQAVEQTMQTAESKAKLRQATRLASLQLATYGVKVSEEQLRTAIEAAVFLASASLQLPPPPSTTDPADSQVQP